MFYVVDGHNQRIRRLRVEDGPVTSSVCTGSACEVGWATVGAHNDVRSLSPQQFLRGPIRIVHSQAKRETCGRPRPSTVRAVRVSSDLTVVVRRFMPPINHAVENCVKHPRPLNASFSSLHPPTRPYTIVMKYCFIAPSI